MKQLLISILILLFTTGAMAQRTVYYEREAIVVNNMKSASRGDGHFITFTSTHCYDSDIDGFSEQTGTLKYEDTDNNGIRKYAGSSYFGYAQYFFANDYSRINIYANDTIYVYAQKRPPYGVKKSSRPKRKSTTTTITIQPQSTYTPPVQQTETRSRKEPESRYGWYDCPTCINGRCQICGGDKITENAYLGGEEMVCNVCDRFGNCSACGGKGKKYGIIK